MPNACSFVPQGGRVALLQQRGIRVRGLPSREAGPAHLACIGGCGRDGGAERRQTAAPRHLKLFAASRPHGDPLRSAPVQPVRADVHHAPPDGAFLASSAHRELPTVAGNASAHRRICKLLTLQPPG